VISTSPEPSVPPAGDSIEAATVVPLGLNRRLAKGGSPSARSRMLSWTGLTGLLVIIGLGGLVVWSRAEFGSIESAIGYLRGERLIPDAYSKSFGSVEQGSAPVVAFTLTNFTGRPITVLGGSSTCTCVLLDKNFPLTIPASEHAILKIVVRTHRRRGGVAGSVSFYSDDPDAHAVVVRVSGRVLDIAKAPSQGNLGDNGAR
jgi:hypothetical protein